MRPQDIADVLREGGSFEPKAGARAAGIVEALGEACSALLLEQAAWAERNAKRGALRKWMMSYLTETAEYFDRDDCLLNGEVQLVRQFDALRLEAQNAQRALGAARARTRRKASAARAALEEGK